jgi:hypothetical protein
VERRSLIRLVTQFDRPTARPAAATPTCSCGCSSCCCCCIVTASAASIYTAVHAQRALHRTAREAPERVSTTFPLPGFLGFFALPLAGIALFLTAGAGSGTGSILFALAVWFGAVTLAFHLAGAAAPWKRAALIVSLGTAAFVGEFFLWLAAASE